jgi:hypothetical protein
MNYKSFLLIISVSLSLSSCEFNCSVGKAKKDVEVTGTVKVKEGARIYNNIELQASGVKVDKAYLIFDNGERVPDDNFVDFTSPVKIHILVDSGWVEENGKVMLGASEKITAESGNVVVEEVDLFEKYPEGISAEDARSIYLSAIFTIKEGAPPTSFTVSFRVWDKKGAGFIEGSFKLYSK